MLEMILSVEAVALGKSLFEFVFGQPHKLMGAAYLLFAVNMVVSRQKKTPLRLTVSEIGEKVTAYTVLYIVAHVMDVAAVDAVFGWQGTTHVALSLYIIRKELTAIADMVQARYGISVPVITERLSQMGDALGTEASPDINARITRLREELLALEEQQTPLEPQESNAGSEEIC